MKAWLTPEKAREAFKQLEQAERKQRLEEIRTQANEKLFEYGWKNGLTKDQTRRKYRDLMWIDDAIEYSQKVFQLVEGDDWKWHR